MNMLNLDNPQARVLLLEDYAFEEWGNEGAQDFFATPFRLNDGRNTILLPLQAAWRSKADYFDILGHMDVCFDKGLRLTNG